MPTVIPYIPQRITVHLGTPNSDAENVTVSFPDYVKNVASSEIYPTWDEDALRANIYAIVSFALNRSIVDNFHISIVASENLIVGIPLLGKIFTAPLA